MLAAVVVIVLAALAVTVASLSGSAAVIHTQARFVAGTPEDGRAVRLDTTLYLPARTPAPAVLLAHGFGGSKASVASDARALARRGYVVLAYTARGFGKSGGLIHLDAPAFEVHDASLLVTYLSSLPQISRDGAKPRIAVAGSSYGGALALLLAGTDARVRAVGADITWNNLAQALFPNAAGDPPGVFKKLWAGFLFQAANTGPASDPACGRFAAQLCTGYQQAAQTGRPSAGLLALLRASSPATVLNKITAPTLLSQGEQDALFPLSEADANARGIAARGTPVRVLWRAGGHDGVGGTAEALSALTGWFDDVFAGRAHGSQPFEIAEQGSALSATSGRTVDRTLHVDTYPGLAGHPAPHRAGTVSGPPQTIVAPAGGNPAAITSVPVLGPILGQAAALPALSALGTIPGQVAQFVSGRLPSRLLIAGAPTVVLTITARTSTDATLFVALHDLASDGTDVLPSNLVAPLRLSGLRPGTPRTVTVRLPSVIRDVAAGHRLRLSVASTDLAYQLPADPRGYTVSLERGSAPISVPTADGRVVRPGHPAAWLLTGIGVCLLAGAGVALVFLRRRLALHADPALVAVPVSIAGLVKEYADGYRAVDDVTFRVERGQVVGLLGPNGAGKTTTLRVLVGLITPTAGAIHVFGEPVAPGAAVLARLGAFIEGPGFLPHLSGRENLRLYWAASGRAADEADFDTALDIAGLGASIERRVKTYSHGMKQRLGIAQAMLGLPEVLVLDEPTNGLDPPQIAEMREVLRRYADSGRTVVVSSHLLAEVEQTCSHVVVMHRGRLVAAGSVAEIAGAGGVQLAVDDPDRAAQVLAAAGITAHAVPARRALEDVFLDLVGEDATP
ncbi:MAG: ABC transporter [Pseudonocardiales bacterium]|nr:MAG: ABC transporter [Pseudonocardiales bacterium]